MQPFGHGSIVKTQNADPLRKLENTALVVMAIIDKWLRTTPRNSYLPTSPAQKNVTELPGSTQTLQHCRSQNRSFFAEIPTSELQRTIAATVSRRQYNCSELTAYLWQVL